MRQLGMLPEFAASSRQFALLIGLAACAGPPIEPAFLVLSEPVPVASCPIVPYEDELDRDGLEARRCVLPDGTAVVLITDPNITWPVIEGAKGRSFSLEEAVLNDPGVGLAYVDPRRDELRWLQTNGAARAVIYSVHSADPLTLAPFRRYVLLSLTPPRYVATFERSQEAFAAAIAEIRTGGE